MILKAMDDILKPPVARVEKRVSEDITAG